MSKGKGFMSALEASAIAALDGRVVTRSVLDFGRRKRADMEQGVITLVASSRPEPSDRGVDWFDVLAVGQCVTREQDDPSDTEDFEHTLVDDITGWLHGQQEAQAVIQEVRYSQQVEHPYGWVAVRVRFGPLDLTGYPDPDELARFEQWTAEKEGPLQAEDNVTLEQEDE